MTGNLEIQAAVVFSSEGDPALEKHLPDTSSTVRGEKRKRRRTQEEDLFMLCVVEIFNFSQFPSVLTALLPLFAEIIANYMIMSIKSVQRRAIQII